MVHYLPAELVSELVSLGMPAPEGGVSSDDLFRLLPAVVHGNEHEDCLLTIQCYPYGDGSRCHGGYWSFESGWYVSSPVCDSQVMLLYYLLRHLLRGGVICFPKVEEG